DAALSGAPAAVDARTTAVQGNESARRISCGTGGGGGTCEQTSIAVESDGIEWRTGSAQDGAACVQAASGEVAGIAESLTVGLHDGPRLAAGVAIGPVDRPAAEDVAEQARLPLAEGQVVDAEEAEHVREVISAIGTLRLVEVIGILR